MAYQFVEISNALWKKGASKDYENKLKAFYHHAVATEMAEKAESSPEEFDFKLLLSHSTEAVSVFQDAKMLEDHDTWVRRNDTVHYETPEPIIVPLFTLEQAMSKV